MLPVARPKRALAALLLGSLAGCGGGEPSTVRGTVDLLWDDGSYVAALDGARLVDDPSALGPGAILGECRVEAGRTVLELRDLPLDPQFPADVTRLAFTVGHGGETPSGEVRLDASGETLAFENVESFCEASVQVADASEGRARFTVDCSLANGDGTDTVEVALEATLERCAP